MIEFIENSVFFGAFVSLGAYEIGLIMKRKFRLASDRYFLCDGYPDGSWS